MKKLFILSVIAVTFFACSKDSNNVNTASNGGTNYSNGGASGTGTGGSLARFTIAQNYLYVVDQRVLTAYSLANAADPQKTSQVTVGTDVETIYALDDKLFIGSQNAMYIYSISSAGNPALIGQASHVRACDPVVADGQYAYVTVRGGSSCGSTINALEVYDISNITNPSLVKEISLAGPWGLGKSEDRLYVCDGSTGLAVYNITSPSNPVFIKKVTGETFYDVIVLDNLLICMVDGGYAIYKVVGDEITKAGMVPS